MRGAYNVNGGTSARKDLSDLKLHKIECCGRSFSLIFLKSRRDIEKMQKSAAEQTGEILFLAPSLAADFYIETSEEAEIAEAVAAAHAFFFFKRGLPLPEMEFETKFGIKKSSIVDGKLFIKPPKCKLLYTKKETEILGCKTEIFELRWGSVINFFFANSPELVSREALFALERELSAPGVAVSASEKAQVLSLSASAKALPKSFIAISAASLLEKLGRGERRKMQRIEIDGAASILASSLGALSEVKI